MIWPAKAVISCATVALLADASLPSSVDAAGRLTLDAALIIAVGVLWRAVAAKDKQVSEMLVKVTETMTSVRDAVKALETTVAEGRKR